MGMLERFKETINPDNRFRFNYNDDTDKIIVGASCSNVFELPFIYSEIVSNCEIIYKQGIKEVFKLFVVDSDVIEYADKFKSVIKVDLPPELTLKFDSSLLDTFAEIKIVTKDNKILYDEPHQLIVCNPLDVDWSNLYEK